MNLPVDEYRRVLETMPIVCVDGLIVDEQGKFLLVKRENEPLKGEYWFPGGRLLRGEKIEAAIRRKMREELSTEVEVIKLLGHFEEFYERTEQGNPAGLHAISFVFLLRLVQEDIRLDDQSADWGWFEDLPPTFQEYGLY